MKHSTNFQDLVAKVKNLVALAPVLGAISCPVYCTTKTNVSQQPLRTNKPHLQISCIGR